VSTPSWDALVAASALPRLDARALAEQASGRPRAWLIAHGDEPASPGAADAFRALAARRRGGEPLAYLLGWREFRGHRFAVSPAVLVPRPETEGLVEAALARLRPAGPAGVGPRVLDLGTGSGAIAVSIVLERPDAAVTATDASADALAIARTNAAALGAPPIDFRHGDWWGALPADAPLFDLVVSNPPYVAAADPHLLDGSLRHEPSGALVSGPDGLDAIDAIVAGATARLVPGGWLLLEHGRGQGAAVRERLASAGFAEVATLCDLQGLERIGLGRVPVRRAVDPTV
jgi:release factor glutamine methyltransferase